MTVRKLDSGVPSAQTSAFRRALGHYGTGVTVVTCHHDQTDYGMTSNSFASVSLDPPLVLWSIKKNSNSYSAFMEAEHFAVNVLARDQMAISNRFATSGGDKFSGLAFARGKGDAPILDASVAVFQCSTFTRYEGGDHTILVGKVEEFARYDRQALMFCQGQYATVDVAAFSAPLLSEANGKGKQPTPSGDRFLMTSLRLAYGALFRKLSGAREESNLNHAQAAIATRLMQSPGLTECEVAARLGFGHNSTDFEFEKLTDDGVVVRDDAGRLSLTRIGVDKIVRLRERWAEMENEALATFTDGEKALLHRMLNHILQY